jgi:hypothetical protein
VRDHVNDFLEPMRPTAIVQLGRWVLATADPDLLDLPRLEYPLQKLPACALIRIPK